MTNTGVFAGISLIFVVIFFYFVFRKELTANASEIDLSKMPEPKDAITNKKDFIISCIIFVVAVILLVTHSMTGLTVAFIGTAIALATLLVAWKDALMILKRVDYELLLFLSQA